MLIKCRSAPHYKSEERIELIRDLLIGMEGRVPLSKGHEVARHPKSTMTLNSIVAISNGPHELSLLFQITAALICNMAAFFDTTITVGERGRISGLCFQVSKTPRRP